MTHGDFSEIERRLRHTSMTTLRVFLTLTATANLAGNTVHVDLPQMARHLLVSHRSTYDALRTLLRLGVIRRQEPGYYKLNPHVVWCGIPTHQDAACAEWDHTTVPLGQPTPRTRQGDPYA